MKDDNNKDKTENRFHLTSDIQNSVDLEAIQDKVLGASLTASVWELIGISLHLEKEVSRYHEILSRVRK